MAAMWIVATFLLGIGNFALHKAVLESRHPLVESMVGRARLGVGRITMGAEFTVLLATMLMVSAGYFAWGWVYLGYSLFNAVSGWLILTKRI